jgi:intraflagellar transport protein 81
MIRLRKLIPKSKNIYRLELLELLNQVLGELDETHKKVDIRSETQDATNERICGFLTVLGIPMDFTPQLKRDVVHGDKKTINNILHWILQRPQDLKRIAYTSKFLVSLAIPEELLMDEEIRETMQVYKDLQAEFTAVHQNVELLRSESMSPDQLKKEITQLESEKEQLVTKITLFKDKNTDSEFAELLEATSMLRKEQETEAKYADKMNEQRNHLEYCEQLQANTRQRLMDARRNTSDDVTADQMLSNLRNETKKNRELCYEVLGRELQDKHERSQKIEMILNEPLTTQTDIDQLANEVRKLQRDCQTLDDKLTTANPADDNLAIYKTQAAAASKRKENKEQEINDKEKEKFALERLMTEKEAEYVKTKGTKYMKRDDFKQYAASLRGKKEKYKRMKKQLEEIRSELAVLSRTEQILKTKTEMNDELVKKLEESKGIAGYSKIEDDLEEVAKNRQAIDKMKDSSLQELTKVVQSIEAQLKEKKALLAPQIKQLRSYRKKYEEKEGDYMKAKKAYENTLMSFESDKNKLKEDTDKLWVDYKEHETKYHSLNIQKKIYDALKKTIKMEAQFQKNPDSRFSDDFKSLTELYGAKLEQQDEQVRDMKKHQKYVKDNLENNSLQVKLFSNLTRILEAKKHAILAGDQNGIGYEDKGASGYDRFVLRDE